MSGIPLITWWFTVECAKALCWVLFHSWCTVIHPYPWWWSHVLSAVLMPPNFTCPLSPSVLQGLEIFEACITDIRKRDKDKWGHKTKWRQDRMLFSFQVHAHIEHAWTAMYMYTWYRQWTLILCLVWQPKALATSWRSQSTSIKFVRQRISIFKTLLAWVSTCTIRRTSRH